MWLGPNLASDLVNGLCLRLRSTKVIINNIEWLYYISHLLLVSIQHAVTVTMAKSKLLYYKVVWHRSLTKDGKRCLCSEDQP